MVFLAIALDQYRAEIIGDGVEDVTKTLQGIIVEHTAAVFSNKDQMHVQGCNDMPASSIFHLATP